MLRQLTYITPNANELLAIAAAVQLQVGRLPLHTPASLAANSPQQVLAQLSHAAAVVLQEGKDISSGLLWLISAIVVDRYASDPLRKGADTLDALAVLVTSLLLQTQPCIYLTEQQRACGADSVHAETWEPYWKAQCCLKLIHIPVLQVYITSFSRWDH